MAVARHRAGAGPVALDADLDRVPDEVDAAAGRPRGVDEAVAALRDATYAVVSGRGLLLGTALETALKLEETCLRPVRGYSYADLRHGPISVVTDGDDRRARRRRRTVRCSRRWSSWPRDLAAAARRVVGIGGDAAFARACDRARARAGPARDAGARSARSCPAQLVVEGLARALGLDPDNPRGLAKVTTTDPTTVEPHHAPKENSTMSSKAEQILAGLGGADNIVEIEACITRLRTEVEDGSQGRRGGAQGRRCARRRWRPATSSRSSSGPEADNLAEDIEDLM